MWIFLFEFAGVILSLVGWFGFHSVRLLLTGVILILFFDILLSSSGGHLKSFRLALLFLIAGGTAGFLTEYGILTAAMLFYSIYSAVAAVLQLICLMLAVLDRE